MQRSSALQPIDVEPGTNTAERNSRLPNNSASAFQDEGGAEERGPLWLVVPHLPACDHSPPYLKATTEMNRPLTSE